MQHESSVPTIPGYQRLEVIGEGGFGRVYRAQHTQTGRTFAIKVAQLFNMQEKHRARRVARFQRELALCRDLHHPNIVGLVDQGEVEGLPYAVFEYVDGVTLSQYLRANGAMDPTMAKELMEQVLDVLACAHERNIVHRDLKPGNIMITSTGARGSVKVLDFGIGTFLPEAHVGDEPAITSTFDTLGTPAYVPPEHLRGDPVTVRSDLYTWGLVFLECLTGVQAVRGSTAAEIYMSHLSSTELPLPGALGRHPLGTVLRKALYKDPNRRAGSAAQLLGELEPVYVADLVGDLAASPSKASSTDEVTWVGGIASASRRQVTALSCAVTVVATEGSNTEPEILGALQADQISACVERCSEFGGHTVGVLGNLVLVHFGVGSVMDANPRLALRTAATLQQDLMRRSARLKSTQGLQVQFRAGLHTEVVRVARDGSITGLVDSVAHRLRELAPVDTILVSDALRRITERCASFVPLSRDASIPAAERAFLLVGEPEDDSSTVSSDSPQENALVGRAEEMRWLEDWLTGTTSERHNTLVSGDPGIGKSKLAREIRDVARQRSLRVFECRCLPEYQNSALHPIVELVRRHFGMHSTGPDLEQKSVLERSLESANLDPTEVIPVLCLWMSIPLFAGYAPSQYAPLQQRRILVDALQKLLLSFGREQRALLIVEDLHWSDPTTLEFLQGLITAADDSALLLLMTARTRFESPFPTDKLEALQLAPLDRHLTEALVRRTLGEFEVSKVVVDAVVTRTDGVPLFVEEYARMLMDQGALVPDGNTLRFAKNSVPEGIPNTLHDLLMERIERSGAMRETMQLAAVIGREFEVGLIHLASTRAASQIQLDLDTLRQIDLVHRNRQGSPGAYLFRHALIRDAAYDSIPLEARQRAHGRVASAMVEWTGGEVFCEPAVISDHFAKAGCFDEAIGYGTQAASQALARSVIDECNLHCRRVLEWIAHLPAQDRPSAELTIMEIYSKAMMASHGWASPEARQCLDRCQVLIGDENNRGREIETLCARFTSHFVASDRKEVGEIVRQFESLARTDSWATSAAALVAGANHHIEGRYAEAAQALERAVATYDPEHPHHRSPVFGVDVLVWATDLHAQIMWAMGPAQPAFATADRAVQIARDQKHVPSLCHALMYRAQLYQFKGDVSGVLDNTQELLALAGKYGLGAYQAYGAVVAAWASGTFEHCPSILRALEQMQCWCALPYHQRLMVESDVRSGRIERALEGVDECLALCRRIGERYYEAELVSLRAQLLESTPGATERDVSEAWWRAVAVAHETQVYRVERNALLRLKALSGGASTVQTRLAELNEILHEPREE